jgi:hypothetical protein
MTKLIFWARGACAAGVLLAAAFGCGLLEEATAFTVTTKWYKVTIDTASLGVSVPTGAAIPAVPCSLGCDKALITCSGQKYSCKVQCGAGNNCALVASVEEYMHVDITQEINSKAGTKALSKAELSSAAYSTEKGNSLNFATPKIEVFIGAGSATTSSGATRFATLPSIAAGQMLKPTALKDITSEGNAALQHFILNRQPFRFFIKATLTFASGSLLPQGKLVFEVQARIKVTPLA